MMSHDFIKTIKPEDLEKVDNLEFIRNTKLELYKHNVAKLKSDGTSFTPNMILFPIPVDSKEYNFTLSQIPKYNLMIDSIARNKDFLYSTLEESAKSDEFVAGLLNISKKVNSKDNLNRQSIHLGLFRHDFMMCSESKVLKLVEWNTIACSISTFGDGIYKIYEDYIIKYPELYGFYKDKLIKSNIVKDYCNGLTLAFNKYLETRVSDLPRSNFIIMFVVDDDETNLFDIYNIQCVLKEIGGVNSVKASFKELNKTGKLNTNGDYTYNEQIVALFYFRTGYSIESFQSQDDNGEVIGWKVREMIEMSNSIKAPDIDSLLVTLKVFQEKVLDKKLLYELLIKYEQIDSLDKEFKVKAVEDLSRNFAEIFSFNSLSKEDKEKWILKLKSEYNDYVIKPLKEGGNNNYNYEKVYELADTRNFSVLNQSLVMKRIMPPSSSNIVLKGCKLVFEDVITEIGFFAVIITDQNEKDSNSNYIKVIHNLASSPFFRTKATKEPEGGMSIGASAANTGYLVEGYL